MPGDIKIDEQPVPMPESWVLKFTNQLESMSIGQSFIMPLEHRDFIYPVASKVGIKVKTRKIDESNVRVWRAN